VLLLLPLGSLAEVQMAAAVELLQAGAAAHEGKAVEAKQQ
jgi:hypothetical protein